MVVEAGSTKMHRKGDILAPRDLASAGPVIPVIVIQRLEDAVPLANALLAGGVTVLEITLRSKVALQAIEAIANAVPEVTVGAGTVRSALDARAAKDAGSRFAVSPGYLEEVGDACGAAGLPLLPGVSTASEVMAANAGGYDFLKLFPATAVGGVDLLKALAGPFPDIKFCPTGGITLETAPQFLMLPNVLVCGGSWLTPQDAVSSGDWARITHLAQQASHLRQVKG
jgi:2-dehydro-3-deoxyphosphogluconate aldolase / (4S)-4-hydroxy-2-oxoglutarate aldolase